MPGTRRSRSKRRASALGKTAQTNRGKRSRAVSVPRAISLKPFAERRMATLTYCDSVTITPVGTAVLVAQHRFRANGINDPDAEFGGHQPYGHDQYANLYTHYSVKRAVIDVSYADGNSVGANWFPMMVGVYKNDTTDNITNASEIREVPGSVSKILANDTVTSVRDVYERDSRFPSYDQNRSAAAFFSEPAEQVYFNVFSAGTGAFTLTSNTVVCFVKITYEIEVWEPKKLAIS